MTQYFRRHVQRMMPSKTWIPPNMTLYPTHEKTAAFIAFQKERARNLELRVLSKTLFANSHTKVVDVMMYFG